MSGNRAVFRTWLLVLMLTVLMAGCQQEQPVYNTRFLAFAAPGLAIGE